MDPGRKLWKVLSCFCGDLTTGIMKMGMRKRNEVGESGSVGVRTARRLVRRVEMGEEVDATLVSSP